MLQTIFPEEQKWCRNGTRRTDVQIYIDDHILNEVKTKQKIVAMA